MKYVKIDEGKLLSSINIDIQRIMRLKQNIISLYTLLYSCNDFKREDIEIKIKYHQEMASANLKSICDHLKILNLHQNNTYITSDDDILLMEMVYMDIFDNIIFLTKEENNSLDIRYKDVKTMLKTKIGKARFKLLIRREWWL